MTSIAKRFERKGYIARTTSPLYQRVKLVNLTQEGRQLANEWRGIMQAMLSRVEEVLTTQELEQFTVLILKVARAFQDNGSLKPQEKKASSRKITIEE